MFMCVYVHVHNAAGLREPSTSDVGLTMDSTCGQPLRRPCVHMLHEILAKIFFERCRDNAMAAAAVNSPADDLTAAEAALARAAEHDALRRRARHHAMLAALCGAAPAFPAAAQLASRWLAAHLLSNHVTEPISELLTAAVFSSEKTVPVPGKPDLLLRFILASWIIVGLGLMAMMTDYPRY